MTRAVKQDIAADPRDIRLLGAAGMVTGADRVADAVEMPWLWRTDLIGLAGGERRTIRNVLHCRIPDWVCILRVTMPAFSHRWVTTTIHPSKLGITASRATE